MAVLFDIFFLLYGILIFKVEMVLSLKINSSFYKESKMKKGKQFGLKLVINFKNRKRRKMMKMLPSFMILLLLFCYACGVEEEKVKIDKKEFAASTTFGNLTQAQRNLYILGTTASYVANQYGTVCNCKKWARDVVQSASSYQANIPSTCPDASGWYWCPWGDQDVQHINYIPYSYPIYAATPGNIVQLNWSSGGPHTAIITANAYGTVCFAEANYTSCKATSGRCQSVSSFISSAPNHTVYEVIGH